MLRNWKLKCTLTIASRKRTDLFTKSGVTVALVRFSVLCSLIQKSQKEILVTVTTWPVLQVLPPHYSSSFLFQSATCFLTPIVLSTQLLQMGSVFKPREQETDVVMEMPTSQWSVKEKSQGHQKLQNTAQRKSIEYVKSMWVLFSESQKYPLVSSQPVLLLR